MFADKFANETVFGPSMATIRARQLAAFGGRCKCGKHKSPIKKSNGAGRTWLSCERCLGTIRQLS